MGALEADDSRYGKVGGGGHSGVTVVSCAGGRPFVQEAVKESLPFPRKNSGRAPWRGTLILYIYYLQKHTKQDWGLRW